MFTAALQSAFDANGVKKKEKCVDGALLRLSMTTEAGHKHESVRTIRRKEEQIKSQ